VTPTKGHLVGAARTRLFNEGEILMV
jgi:hypothetical protein